MFVNRYPVYSAANQIAAFAIVYDKVFTNWRLGVSKNLLVLYYTILYYIASNDMES